MIEYIYFVKCPNCEDEPFNFFNDAKDFALGCLNSKPIITQTEVCRNDFGECTDSNDLGTIWSWEDMMTDVSADDPAVSVFNHGDFAEYNPDRDPEFDSLDNTLDNIPDNFRKPVPADMTIESLVEEMEENEDTVECKWCEELFDKSECRYEVNLGWLCSRCEAAIKSRGETLTFRENSYWDFLDENCSVKESFDPNDTVEFEYDKLNVTLFSSHFSSEYGHYSDEHDVVLYDYVYEVSKEDVANDLWENGFITEEDTTDVPGGLEALEYDPEWSNFLDAHFDEVLEKYYDKLLVYYKEKAAEEAAEKSSYEDYEKERYDDYLASQEDDRYDESLSTTKSMLEELEESEDYTKRLTLCPECGAEKFDKDTGICINCGFEV